MLGDQGEHRDTDHGYIKLVLSTRPDDEVTIKIESVLREHCVRDNHGAGESSEFGDPLVKETLGEGE